MLPVAASALTIGRPEGAVWIGKPLDLRVPVQLEGSGGACPSVGVKLGDATLSDRDFGTTVEPGRSPDAPWLRIRTTRPIDEPVVTVNVRVGCGATMVREFALLADPPPVSAIDADRAERALGASLPPMGAQPPRSGARSTEGRSASTGARTRDTAPAPRAGGAVRAAPRTPAVTTGGRLRVDALDPRAAAAAAGAAGVAAASGAADDYTLPPAWLKIATRLRNIEAGAVAPLPQGGASDAAATPAAAASAPQDAQSADRQSAALRAQMAQRDRTIESLRTELAQAREAASERPWWLWPLLLLLAVLLAVAGVLWRRARRQAAEASWWQPSEVEPYADLPADPPIKPAGLAAVAAAGDIAGAGATPAPVAVAADPGPDTISTLPPDGPEPVSADRLLDVQQQAEFCLSLGQFDQAVGVLADHLDEYGVTSPLMYMELLRLLHSQGRKADYDTTRRECRKALGLELPAYDDFQDEGRSLAAYPEAVERIEKAWPRREVLGVIEGFLFQAVDSQGRSPFDLPAYRELLALYGAAQERIANGSMMMASDAGTTSAMGLLAPMAVSQPPTAPLPLAAGIAGGAATPVVAGPPPGTIDFDLSDLEASSIDTIPKALKGRTPPAERAPPAAHEADPALTVPNDFDPVPPDFQLFDPELEDSIRPGASIKKPPTP